MIEFLEKYKYLSNSEKLSTGNWDQEGWYHKIAARWSLITLLIVCGFTDVKSPSRLNQSRHVVYQIYPEFYGERPHAARFPEFCLAFE